MADETTTNIIELEAEQENYFKLLASATSESLAYFYCCIKYDLPFDLDCVPRDGTKSRWTAYRNNLRRKGLDRNKRNGNPRVFLDGLTDITAVFGERLDSGEFTRAVTIEQNARDGKQGTKRQRAEWGELGDLTSDDYDRLDELFETFSARAKSTGSMDEQAEYTLRTVSRMSLSMEKALAAGKIDTVNKLNKAIQDNLAAESLRKKDEKPVAEVRIDNIVDALEKAGMVKKGKILPLEELLDVLVKFMRRNKYGQTVDAAEHCLWYIYNTMARNDGYEEAHDITKAMRIPAENQGEFAETPNEAEIEAYQEFGIVRKGERKKPNGRRETESE